MYTTTDLLRFLPQKQSALSHKCATKRLWSTTTTPLQQPRHNQITTQIWNVGEYPNIQGYINDTKAEVTQLYSRGEGW